MVLVSIFLLVGLGQDEGICSLLDGILALVVEVCGSGDGVGECGDLGVGVDGISAIAEAEWGHLGGGAGSIVTGELSSRQEGVPVVLAVADIGAEHVLKGSVGLFSLAISLGV